MIFFLITHPGQRGLRQLNLDLKTPTYTPDGLPMERPSQIQHSVVASLHDRTHDSSSSSSSVTSIIDRTRHGFVTCMVDRYALPRPSVRSSSSLAGSSGESTRAPYSFTIPKEDVPVIAEKASSHRQFSGYPRARVHRTQNRPNKWGNPRMQPRAASEGACAGIHLAGAPHRRSWIRYGHEGRIS